MHGPSISTVTKILNTAMRKLLLLAFSLLLTAISVNTAQACHAIALVNPLQQSVSGGIQVTASSDSPTCGCDEYWLDIEVRCNIEPFNATAFSPGYYGPLSTYPFFQSGQMLKPSCIVQQYPWVTIPFSGLCPGVTYKYRMRENHNGSVGPWTATYTFTVPGTQSPLQITASATPTSICGTQTVQLNSTISGGCSSNKTISWTGGTVSNSTIANPTATVSTTTTFTVTYQDLCSSQTATASVTITVAPPPIAGTASATPNPICAGQTTTLTLTGSTGNVQWQSASSSSGPWTNIAGATATTYTTPALSATTYYQAVVSNPCGSVTSNVVTVTVNPSPNVTAVAAPATICAGQSSTLTASGATAYSWAAPVSSTNASVTVSPTATTVYSVTGTTAGCSTTVNVTVTVNPIPTITATASPVSVCAGNSSTLTASGGNTYQWAPPLTSTSSTVTVTPSATTVYSVTGYTAAGCSATANVTVTVGPPPATIASASPSAICAGQSSTLTASGAITYDWQPGNLTGSSVTVSPTATTVYTVTGYTAPGCSSVATVTVTVNPLPVVTASASPASICAGQSSTLTGSGASTYSWTPGPLSGTSVTVTPSTTTIYTVTGTDAAGCSATANVTVTVNPIPVVTATASPTSVCPGQSSTLTGGGASTYNWQPINQAGTSVTVTPTATTIYTVTGTTAAGCSATANVTVTINPSAPLTVTASPGAICAGASSTLSVSGANTYVWQPGNLTGSSVTVTPSATTTYTVTGTSAAGCQSIDSVTVTVNPIPVVTATASPASICIGSSSTLTGGGASTYQWQPVNLPGASITVTPTSTTIYTVTGTTAAGCSATANVTVTVNPAPVVTVTAIPDSICPGGSSTLTATGGSTYDWLPGPMSGASVTVSPSATTTYTVSIATAAGCSIEDSVTVFVAPPIVLSTSGADVLCFGGNTGSATVSITGGVGTPTIVWNTTPAQNTATASGLIAGTYGVTVTDDLGCTANASVTINEPTQLTVAAAGIDVTCFGGCNGQLIVIPSGGTPPYNISWSNGCSQPSCNNVCAGTYTVTVTDANGCTATATATVNEPPQLVVTMFSSTSNCNQNDGEAWVNVSGGTPNYTVSWNTTPGPKVNDTAFALVPGTYVATVSDFYGCTIVDSVVVPNTPGVQASIASSVNATCNGSCDGEATASGTGGTGPYTYSWNTSPAQATATATGLCAGTYIITITDSNGCTSTATVTITEPVVVAAVPNTPSTICIGQSVTLTSSATGGNGVYTYTWSGGATVSPTQTTTYNVVATDGNGCVSLPVNVTVTVNPPLDVAATGTDSICPGGSTPLQATGSGGNGTYSYVWQPGSGLSNSTVPNPSASPSVTTTYTVYVSDGCGTPVDSAMVTVTVNPLPQVVIGSDITSACEPGDPSSACINFLDLSTIGSGSVTGWAWDFGDGNTSSVQNPANCYAQDGAYPVTLTATSDQGCVATVQVPYTITIHPAPEPEFTFGPQPTTIVDPEICFTDMSVGAATWSWNFADPVDVNPTSSLQNPCHMYTDSGTYCVELIVTTTNGCVDSITHCVIIQPDYTIYIPNAFSPNDDNVNDTFFPQGIGLDDKKFEMFIFDRWGNLIYYTTDMHKGWDGKANQGNNVAQQDVYVWKIMVTDIMGDKHQFIGHVTLVK